MEKDEVASISSNDAPRNFTGGQGLGLSFDQPETQSTVSGVQEITRVILDIIYEYGINKFDDADVRFTAGAEQFLATIDQYVLAQARVEACLPAFPFKSANKVYKVLGSLPDKAEQLALERLDNMCERIKSIYPPGAKVTIISDGITYNDLLCISDRDTWAYGESLRDIVACKKFHNIGFARMKDLLDFSLPEELREITYVSNCTNFRRSLLNKYGKEDLNIDQEIATNPDTRLTYLGYRRFLESDLRHIFTLGEKRSSNSYKRDVKYLAKQMLIRGYAFAAAVKNAFPNHLRLSIHESVGEHKISMSLLNTKSGYTTPWHCAVALLANGDWVSAPKGEFEQDPRLELVYEDGRPSYFKEIRHSEDCLTIRETSASYLQAPKLIKSGYSTPSTASGSSGYSTPSSRSPNLASEQDTTVRATAGPPKNDLASENYGKRLLPEIIDAMAVSEPKRTVFSLATVTDSILQFRHISAYQFARAIDKTALFLRSHLGARSSIQPVGYIGPHDLRHILLTYGCVKAGYAALFLSAKNSTEGAIAVLDALDCSIWVQPSGTKPIPIVRDIMSRRTLEVLDLPSLDELLDTKGVVSFPYTKTFEDAANEPFCFLHTSGSTGVPKPIPWSHALIGTMDAVRLLPPVDGDDGLAPWTSDWKNGDKIYSSFPMSHGAGIIMDILMPALFDLHCILGPADVLPNMNLIEILADQAKIDIWSMVPSLVDELGETPEVLSKLKSSKFICASGGPVSPVSTGKVNDTIRVLNLTGTTEGLFIGNLVVPREDWHWFAFHPYSGFEFKEVEPDTYEHWVHRNEHSSLFQGIFHTFPDKTSVNFKDLYTRHPTKPNLWTFKGRSDDLVVLSNGYKISPLETEALVTTHPGIIGCLVVGTGRPQAALIIELKDPSTKNEDLIESIWATVERANTLSRHTNQLLRDFVTFAEPHKPFIRTDKGTIKRAATLALYSDYIERFYGSRNDDAVRFAIDASSVESIQDTIRKVLASSLPAVHNAELDDDLFGLGLDSLGVFAAIKSLRASLGLQQELGPRHLYANPTLAKFAVILKEMAARERIKPALNGSSNKGTKPIASMLATHRARQSFRLNALDYVNPNHHMGLNFYLPLREGVSFEQVFSLLQNGLNKTLELIPAISGKMMQCSEQEVGYKRGDLCVTIPPLSMSRTFANRLVYNDLSQTLHSFEELRNIGFLPSAVRDELVLPEDTFPKMPADILVAQANFVEGGCVLAVNLNHCCLDAIGVMVFLKAWAENCRYLQGDSSATCDWYDPESFNHSLPEILHEFEGYSRPAEEVDFGTWGFLPFTPPDCVLQQHKNQITKSGGVKEGALPPPPKYPLHSVWPLPSAERKLDTTMFLITPENLQKLKSDVIADSDTKSITSTSDIVQAFLWRAAIRARYRVAKEDRGETFGPEEMSILELPTDGRPYFSSQLPSTYMGSMLVLNRSSMSIETLCSPQTSIARIAQLLRSAASRITPSVVHDAFTLLQSLPDHDRFSTANMGLSHMHAMISNMMLFQPHEISFGDTFFANGGSPESMRPQLERGNGRFRFLVIFPMKKDGGIELVMGTFPEERAMLDTDEEFTRYAKLVDVCSDGTRQP